VPRLPPLQSRRKRRKARSAARQNAPDADTHSATRRRHSSARDRAHGPGGCHRRQHPEGPSELSSAGGFAALTA
jgi:hypothetical protein